MRVDPIPLLSFSIGCAPLKAPATHTGYSDHRHPRARVPIRSFCRGARAPKLYGSQNVIGLSP
jgi:hypothetical protein